jgi:hypothetical protein
MLTEFGLKSEALDRLASIVRGADTARLDLAPQAAGFLAASLVSPSSSTMISPSSRPV